MISHRANTLKNNASLKELELVIKDLRKFSEQIPRKSTMISPELIIEYAKQNGISAEELAEIKAEWRRMWPEMSEYFDWLESKDK